MNTRDYKQYGKGEYYHIYNRGNLKADIFLDDEDYKSFLFRLQRNLFPEEDFSKIRTQKLPANCFSLVAYCLMPNHYHLLIRQNTDLPTSKLITKICTSYAKYFNKKYDRVGHLFQDKFRQALVDNDSYLLWLSAYIHQNPAVARLVDKPEMYPWSSYPF
jgi:putative transposase